MRGDYGLWTLDCTGFAISGLSSFVSVQCLDLYLKKYLIDLKFRTSVVRETKSV